MMFIATVVNMAIVSSPHWSIEISNAICVRHLLRDISVFPVIFLLKSSSVWTRFQLFPVFRGFRFQQVECGQGFSVFMLTDLCSTFLVFVGFISMEFSVYRVSIFVLTLHCLKCLKKLAQVINNMGFQWIVLTEHHATIVSFQTARRIVRLNNTLLFYVF